MIGEMVYADAVMMSRLQRYRERVGDEWGAKSPASVAFILDLVDVRRGDIVWSARFDETQKSLSESIFSLGDIGAARRALVERRSIGSGRRQKSHRPTA